ncbi:MULTISPECIES: Holliday junction branch migration protein RuvA [Herpetosiphon]|uniref:Holliday junction branch migration protein RuvA n=1 Tax=Herpetosiphon TaxID=64 RepID=UPI000D7BE7E8|nr:MULTISPECIES: Holliday junction branch migration protein RuvA [Herpetosiphon]MBM7844809.1 Holliday junction DNA helicase RuvA [Herpetosiphon giganteus]
MIASVRGVVQFIGLDQVIIDVHGVGLAIAVPRTVLATIGAVGDSAQLYTHLHVREDMLALFGFNSPAQRALFELLLGVSGIGPKVALALLSAASPEELQQAIAREDTIMLSKVPGIGKKTAARLVLELKGKFGVSTISHQLSTNPGLLAINTELIDILTSLGYSSTEAQAALNALPADAPADTEERLRLALQYFGGV